MDLLHYLACCADKKTFDIFLEWGEVRVEGGGDGNRDRDGNTPADLFEGLRELYVVEDEETRGYCREALVRLVNWREEKPVVGEVYFDDEKPVTDSEPDMFYDFEEKVI